MQKRKSRDCGCDFGQTTGMNDVIYSKRNKDKNIKRNMISKICNGLNIKINEKKPLLKATSD